MDHYLQFRAAIYAGVTGDALGVPVEFSSRQELALCSVKNMMGYGRYDEPEGTWSDDTSLSLCTMESLLKGYDLEHIGQTFCRWLYDSHWTPTGYVFDSGLTTFMALDRIRNDSIGACKSGGSSEDDNGNGSLMRILPAALFFASDPIEPFLERIHEVSAITHAHPRSKIGCGLYALLVRELCTGTDKTTAYRNAVTQALAYYRENPGFAAELPHFVRILSLQIPSVDRDLVESSGYIIHTLEASIWCFMRHNSAQKVILEAVNLGLDTDTTAMVAGSLAGLAHGITDIPQIWIDSLARIDEIKTVIDPFARAAADRYGAAV